MSAPLFLFVRPPRPLWPMNGPSSAFWPPLAFASLAAALRDRVRGVRVGILDAPAIEMGWRSLEAEIRSRRPAFVGLGEEAVSCVEGLRLGELAHDLSATVIAGGCFFSHVAAEVLGTGLVDVVVHGEGERTLVELVQVLLEGRRTDLRSVAGLTFADSEEIVHSPPRELMADLDDLPFPAYDLLPVERYGAQSRNHPHLAAIELSRGCVGSCDFCVLWRQMGRFRGHQPVPSLRVKSPARAIEEVQRLHQSYGRRYLGWVDPCFNAHPTVPGQVAEGLLKAGLRIGQSAWMRCDSIVRDAQTGALESCVRAGLNEVYLGVERPDGASLQALHKTTRLRDAREAMRILTAQFPEVFTLGTFIYGLPGDSPATMRAIHRLAVELQLDQVFFIPMTPLPGTVGWRPELWDPTGLRFRHYHFLPGAPSDTTRQTLERALLLSLLFSWNPTRLRDFGRRLFSGDPRKRRVNWRLLLRAARFHAARALQGLTSGARDAGLVFPAWYER